MNTFYNGQYMDVATFKKKFKSKKVKFRCHQWSILVNEMTATLHGNNGETAFTVELKDNSEDMIKLLNIEQQAKYTRLLEKAQIIEV